MQQPRNRNRRKLIRAIQLSIRATRVFTKKRNLSSNLQIHMDTNSNSATIACSPYLSRAVCKGSTKWSFERSGIKATGSPSRSSSRCKRSNLAPKFITRATCETCKRCFERIQVRTLKAILISFARKESMQSALPRGRLKWTKLLNWVESFRIIVRRKALMTRMMHFWSLWARI